MFQKIALIVLTALFFAGCSSKKPSIETNKPLPTVTENKPDMTYDLDADISAFAENIGDKVFFAFDSYALSEDGKEQLKAQANWLLDPNRLSLVLTIEGHCDERGTRDYNLALGLQRAEAVAAYLISQGVDSNRIRTVSYGKERPAVHGVDNKSYAQNRRAVSVVLKDFGYYIEYKI